MRGPARVVGRCPFQPAATTVIEEPEEIDAEAEAEFIEASVPESTDDSEDDDSDDDFAVEESDEDDDAEPMDVDAGAPAPAATLEPAATETALVPAAPLLGGVREATEARKAASSSAHPPRLASGSQVLCSSVHPCHLTRYSISPSALAAPE